MQINCWCNLLMNSCLTRWQVSNLMCWAVHKDSAFSHQKMFDEYNTKRCAEKSKTQFDGTEMTNEKFEYCAPNDLKTKLTDLLVRPATLNVNFLMNNWHKNATKMGKMEENYWSWLCQCKLNPSNGYWDKTFQNWHVWRKMASPSTKLQLKPRIFLRITHF